MYSAVSPDELDEILDAADHVRECLFLCGWVDKAREHITLINANGSVVRVPFSKFTPSGTHTPDFDEFAIIDYGHALRFGDYEAASDSIL